ncbi:uncharacterized protein Z519_05383 [Cladophialophora bantiana CBS 173.52]|uniref:beta-glucosidase n=1 Tax=Cladophialophora bantiana (strain ATCC 10958 / CBS 173.52 / CDC B-1940 / NIH 8579) TaxID=1442370 RepID=A0A0D2G658_CLAB1|nr:uncharacterized protein Z519_05383 [Cladophialophora bantiana CBS 173.52]KIW94067.1 hypothetical protein Z519_05383 [Cladophialophora bantiana CBS 173.52]
MDCKDPKSNSDLFYITAKVIFTLDELGMKDFGLSVYGIANLYLDGEFITEETTRKQEAGSISFRKRACDLAAEADYSILCTGLNEEWECEGFDKLDFSLPPGVDELISGVLAAQPNTIIVTQSGTLLKMLWESEARSIVHAWCGGSEEGNGVADLCLIWLEEIRDNPAYLNWGSIRGRELYGEDVFAGYKFYDDLDRSPLFSFGYGISYITLALTPIAASRESLYIGVINTGKSAGTEAIQVCIHAMSSVVLPAQRELHGFVKVELMSGGC